VAAATGDDLRDLPGAGAAGGLGFGLAALGNARLVSGVALLLELTGFDGLLGTADLVVVGEGSLDAQSLRGKGPVGVARAAAERGVPVVAVAGRNALAERDWRGAGLQAVYSLSDLEDDPEACMREAERLLRTLALSVAADWVPGPAGPTPPTAQEYRSALMSTVVAESD
jgi:glycerate kinase